jgi:hypothetical protein
MVMTWPTWVTMRTVLLAGLLAVPACDHARESLAPAIRAFICTQRTAVLPRPRRASAALCADGAAQGSGFVKASHRYGACLLSRCAVARRVPCGRPPAGVVPGQARPLLRTPKLCPEIHGDSGLDGPQVSWAPPQSAHGRQAAWARRRHPHPACRPTARDPVRAPAVCVLCACAPAPELRCKHRKPASLSAALPCRVTCACRAAGCCLAAQPARWQARPST